MAAAAATAASNDLFISYLKTFIIYLLYSTVCVCKFHHAISSFYHHCCCYCYCYHRVLQLLLHLYIFFSACIKCVKIWADHPFYSFKNSEINSSKAHTFLSLIQTQIECNLNGQFVVFANHFLLFFHIFIFKYELVMNRKLIVFCICMSMSMSIWFENNCLVLDLRAPFIYIDYLCGIFI